MTRYDPEVHHRRSIRLKGYDYAEAGAYFVTIAAQDRLCLFGEVVDGAVVLTEAGTMVRTAWENLSARFPEIALDAFVVMPNHLHGIIVIAASRRGEPCVRPGHPTGDSVGDATRGGQGADAGQGADEGQGEHKVRPYRGRPDEHPRGTAPGSVGRAVQAFKSITTHAYIAGVKGQEWTPFPGRLWHRNYYERIIRDDRELDRIRQYVADNPAAWPQDAENPRRVGAGPCACPDPGACPAPRPTAERDSEGA